ncbi:MAG TPA: hypothetical protein PKL48_04720, partial [Thermodesulfobacteriota bacterium]|nr:hypothetical protein [Thermodesulfobacteriota bacterium]
VRCSQYWIPAFAGMTVKVLCAWRVALQLVIHPKGIQAHTGFRVKPGMTICMRRMSLSINT